MNKTIPAFPDFSTIPFDSTEIPQSQLNIDGKTRSNLFSWNGQFSPQLIEALLNKYAEPGYFVLDPFLGSGTTLAESINMGCSAYGIELNAAAYYMAKTYEISNIEYLDRSALISRIDTLLLAVESDNLIVDTITGEIKNNVGTVYANVLSTLIVLIDIFSNEVKKPLLMKKWDNLKAIIQQIPYSSRMITAINGDARHINLQDGVIDLLITSPPYINVFNYHQKFRRSVEALGVNVLKTAKAEFGSNRKNRSNRFLTVIQYCVDMALSLSEVARVCKHGARMIFVVGRESSVLGYSFCNSELIYNIATEIWGLPLLLRQQRAFKNRYGQMIYEDILHFSNEPVQKISEHDITAKAKGVAIRMLRQKYSGECNNKNKPLLLQAINNAAKVKQSEKVCQ